MDDSASKASSLATSRVGGKSLSGHTLNVKGNAELRDTQALNEKLRKEMERKESKLQSLSKELQATRASQHEHQKEVRLLSGSLELLQSEKLQLSQENAKLKRQVDELRKKHVHLSDATKLAAQIEALQQENTQLVQQLSEARGDVALRDQRVQTLQYEVDVAHRALQVQNKYENNIHASSASLPSSLGANRELLRSLYFDLGKAAADNHALSLALANAEQTQQTLAASLQTARADIEVNTARLEELEVVVGAKESTIRDQNLLISCLQEQVADLTTQLDVKGRAMVVVQRERDDVQERYVVLDREYTRLEATQRQIGEEKEAAVAQLAQSRAQLAALVEKWEQERDVVLEEVSRLRVVEQSFQDLQREQAEKQQAFAVLEERQAELQRQHMEQRAATHLHAHQQQALAELVSSRDKQLIEEKERVAALLAERDTLAAALTKSMSLVRQLQERCEEERGARDALARQLDEAVRLKEEMSEAVVKALHEERQRTHSLATALDALRSFSHTTSVTVSSPPPAARPPAASSQDFQWLRQDAAIDQHVRSVYSHQPPQPPPPPPASHLGAAAPSALLAASSSLAPPSATALLAQQPSQLQASTSAVFRESLLHDLHR